nr:immunoglobulin heavy chain junction region [Mus musculus]
CARKIYYGSSLFAYW